MEDVQARELRAHVAQAQYRAFADKIPAFYFTLIIGVSIVALYYHGSVPTWLTTVFPGLLLPVCLVRALWWLRHRGDAVPAEVASRQLSRTTALSLVLAVSFCIWDILLFMYSSHSAARQHVLLVWSCATSAYCVISLLHLRGSIIVVSVLTAPFFAAIVLWNGEGSLGMVAVMANSSSPWPSHRATTTANSPACRSSPFH